MSNPSRVRNNNEIHIETLNRNRFSNFIQRIINSCDCFGSKNEENDLPLVHAVDSVRLVYMRRIEEASLLNLRTQNQPDEQIADEIQQRTVRYRRMKQEKSTIQALGKALKEYESKNKIIISSTRVPDTISFDKTCKISKSTQTEKYQVLYESLHQTDDVQRRQFISNVEENTPTILNNSNDKCTNTDKLDNSTIFVIATKEE